MLCHTRDLWSAIYLRMKTSEPSQAKTAHTVLELLDGLLCTIIESMIYDIRINPRSHETAGYLLSP